MAVLGRFWQGVKSLLAIFPEREFHYRARGKVQYFSISGRTQLGLSLLVAIGVGWTVFSTFYFVTFDRVLREKEFEVAQARRGQKQLLAEVARFNHRLRLVARNLERSRAELLALGRKDAKGTKGARPMTDAERDRVAKSRKALSAQIRILGSAYKELNKRSASLETGLRTFGNEVETMMAEHAKTKRERNRLRRRVLVLRKEMRDMLSAQGRVVTRLDTEAKKSIVQAEEVIAMTGLKSARLLKLINPDGVGGPYTVTRQSDPGTLPDRMARLTIRVRRLEMLRRVIRNLPLAAPLDNYRQTSGFGRRRDPFRGTWTNHFGLDFVNKRGTPIMASAAGTVVYAGWRGGYGWLVELDHGMGIRTRYAHLQKILVGKGQKVSFRQKIGLLGTSGRSTGPHLHYEVLVNGRQVNPINFITAGKYVFKN